MADSAWPGTARTRGGWGSAHAPTLPRPKDPHWETEAAPPDTGVGPTCFPRRCVICFWTETCPPLERTLSKDPPLQTSGWGLLSLLHRSLPTPAPHRPFSYRCPLVHTSLSLPGHGDPSGRWGVEGGRRRRRARPRPSLAVTPQAPSIWSRVSTPATRTEIHMLAGTHSH